MRATEREACDKLTRREYRPRLTGVNGEEGRCTRGSREDLDERRTGRLGQGAGSRADACLHYGSGVFEGIRAYKTERGAAVFRLTDQ